MADVASPSQPRDIPGTARLTVSTPNDFNLPSPARSSRATHLTIDTLASPVTQNGSFEFDRIVKEGEVLKRTRKTKSWKPIYMVLRPHLLSIYRDKNESKLRHQVNLADLTAVARQKDPKRKEKHVFGLFSPSRNYHLSGYSDKDAQDWVEQIRREARMDEAEEEMYLASPGGAKSPYQGFERSIDAQLHDAAAFSDQEQAVRYSSSDMEGLTSPSVNNLALPRQRDRHGIPLPRPRQPSFADYSGADLSDFSDSAIPPARRSVLSLAPTTATDGPGRPSTSSAPRPHLQPLLSQPTFANPPRPSLGGRSISQTGGAPGALSSDDLRRSGGHPHSMDEERVIYHGWIYLLKSKSGVRQWKKVWLVLRPRALALYKNEEEYSASLVLPLKDVIDAVEIDPISRSKTTCMQVISHERNYRFCALDEEGLARVLGALKSLLAKRWARRKESAAAATAAAAGATNTAAATAASSSVPPVTVGPPPVAEEDGSPVVATEPSQAAS